MRGYGVVGAGSGQGQVAETCECGDEPSGSIKCGEFLDQLKTAYLLKKDSAQWSKYMYNTKEGNMWEDPEVEINVLKSLNIAIRQLHVILEQEDEEYNIRVSRPIHNMYYGY